MNLSPEREAWLARFGRPDYPLSSKYDPQWIVDNALGAHCLWLTESLTRVMTFRPGMRVLDLGCGKALSSIFLAKEFGVQVWAVDIGVSPSDNYQRIKDAGVADRVFPLHGDARALPFADGFFDAVVSINAYWFFGTDDFYLPGRFARLLAPGGVAGLIMPGLDHEYGDVIPEPIRPFWFEHVIAYHSPDWWRRHIARAGLMDIRVCDNLDGNDGFDLWHDWTVIMDVKNPLTAIEPEHNIRFVRLVAERKATESR